MYSFGICGIYLSKHAGFFDLIFIADHNYATIHHEAHEEHEVLFFVFLFFIADGLSGWVLCVTM